MWIFQTKSASPVQLLIRGADCEYFPITADREARSGEIRYPNPTGSFHGVLFHALAEPHWSVLSHGPNTVGAYADLCEDGIRGRLHGQPSGSVLRIAWDVRASLKKIKQIQFQTTSDGANDRVTNRKAQSINQLIKQSINQSNDQSSINSANQSINRPQKTTPKYILWNFGSFSNKYEPKWQIYPNARTKAHPVDVIAHTPSAGPQEICCSSTPPGKSTLIHCIPWKAVLRWHPRRT